MTDEVRKALSRWRQGLETNDDLALLASAYAMEHDEQRDATDEEIEADAPKVYETITLHW